MAGVRSTDGYLALEPRPDAVAEARQFLASMLWALGADEVRSDAELVASELATNAVVHAKTCFALTLVAIEGASFNWRSAMPTAAGRR